MVALRATLDSQRRHVLAALDGLSDDQMTAPVLPSGSSCAGLIKHLALADEHYWLQVSSAVNHSMDSSLRSRAPTGPSTMARRQQPSCPVPRRDRRGGQSVGWSRPSDPPSQRDPLWDEWGIDFPTVRSIMLHLIVETATHAGHLDAAARTPGWQTAPRSVATERLALAEAVRSGISLAGIAAQRHRTGTRDDPRDAGRAARSGRRTTSVRGPRRWAAPRTRTRRSIPDRPGPAGASRLRRDRPSPGSCLSCCDGLPQVALAASSAFQSTWSRVLDTTYFFALSIVSAKGTIQSSIQSGQSPVGCRRQADSIIS